LLGFTKIRVKLCDPCGLIYDLQAPQPIGQQAGMLELIRFTPAFDFLSINVFDPNIMSTIKSVRTQNDFDTIFLGDFVELNGNAGPKEILTAYFSSIFECASLEQQIKNIFLINSKKLFQCPLLVDTKTHHGNVGVRSSGFKYYLGSIRQALSIIAISADVKLARGSTRAFLAQSPSSLVVGLSEIVFVRNSSARPLWLKCRTLFDIRISIIYLYTVVTQSEIHATFLGLPSCANICQYHRSCKVNCNDNEYLSGRYMAILWCLCNIWFHSGLLARSTAPFTQFQES
jgi:hypothetical protein